MLNPTWSPDGNRIAFSGLVGGLNDLFVYDLAASTLQRLTNDAFAELDPAWSPDGRQLAFATDRFTTKLDVLDAGEPAPRGHGRRDRRGPRTSAGSSGAKNISPQWTRDGRSLFFLSDRQGITNVYRLAVDGGDADAAHQPAHRRQRHHGAEPGAVGRRRARRLQRLRRRRLQHLRARHRSAARRDGAGASCPANAGVLPPRTAPEGAVAATLEQSRPRRCRRRPSRRAKRSPTSRSCRSTSPASRRSASASIRSAPTRPAACRSCSATCSATTRSATSAQVTSRFDEFGGSVVLPEPRRTAGTGASALDQTPYVSRGFADRRRRRERTAVYVEKRIPHPADRPVGCTGMLAYPFSRAQRVEVSGGFRQIGLKQDVTIADLLAARPGSCSTRREEDLGSFPTLNLGQASAALVYDTSIFGATSPIRGSRYRLEVSQSAGSLNYTGVLADGRTYLMPVRPFTLALRGMYLRPLRRRRGRHRGCRRCSSATRAWCAATIQGSFEAGECGVQPDGSCPAFDRLIGSRVGVANAELRFPLLGALRRRELLRSAAGRAGALRRRRRRLGTRPRLRVRRRRPGAGAQLRRRRRG